MNTRLGYYVEEMYFAGKKNQAMAIASFRADEFGRNVNVTFVGEAGQSRVVGTASPSIQQAA